MGYSDNRASAENSGGMFGLIKKPGCQTRLYVPAFKHETRFRPFGAPDGRGGIQPTREDPSSPLSMTEWLMPLGYIVTCGVKGKATSFLITRSRQEDSKDTPYHLVRSQAYARKNSDINWANLLARDNDGGSPITKPQPAAIMQGIVIKHGDPKSEKYYVGSPKYPALLLLKGTQITNKFGSGIEDLMQERDQNGQLKYQNVVDPNGGYIVSMIQRGLKSVMSQPQVQAGPVSYAQSPAAPEQRSALEQCYDVTFEPEGQLQTPLTQLNLEKWQNWNDIIRYLDDREMTVQLCNAFPAFVTFAALRDTQFEEYVTEDHKKQWSRTAVTPGVALPQNPTFTPTTFPAYNPAPQPSAYNPVPVQSSQPVPMSTTAGITTQVFAPPVPAQPLPPSTPMGISYANATEDTGEAPAPTPPQMGDAPLPAGPPAGASSLASNIQARVAALRAGASH